MRRKAVLVLVAMSASLSLLDLAAHSEPDTRAVRALWPSPREAQAQPDWLLRLPLRLDAGDDLQAPAEMLTTELRRLFGEGAVQESGATVVALRLDPARLPKPEAYSLETTSRGVALCAHDVQGAFWAAHSLLQLLTSPEVRRTPEGYVVPGVRVRDWPESAFRSLMIQGAWCDSLEAWRRNLELLARMKVRYVAYEFGPQVALDLDPEIARGPKFTKAQAKEIVDYGRSLGIEPIGYLNMLGHLERAYQKPPYTDHGGLMIQNDATYDEFVFPILSEMLEIYGPIEYFHCGMDEAWGLFEWLAEEGHDPAQLIAEHVTKVNDFLKARGVKLVIWHDMFVTRALQDELGAPIGPANGGPPRNTARALDSLPKDVILNYWFYESLPTYPALDYLQEKGFQVWASPWKTPFALTRYAQARDVPTLGTMWSGPPSCFYSQTYNRVTAYYAAASWNPEAASAEVNAEVEIATAAGAATELALWARRRLTFPTDAALLLRPSAPQEAKRVRWPGAADTVEQHHGVPFDFSAPAVVPPLEGDRQSLERVEDASYVLLRGDDQVVLDGVNKARGTDELILYAAPQTTTGTNVFGVEASVSSRGEVLEVTQYGSGNLAIPTGGFVLSAHLGKAATKAHSLQRLSPGSRVAVFDVDDNWLGGYGTTVLKLRLPDDQVLSIAGVDKPRGADELVLYWPGYGDGTTGTNDFGVEVVVSAGRVVDVRENAGSSAIPADGYVLSAHRGETGANVEALRKLKPGDAAPLRIVKGHREYEPSEALRGRSWHSPVNAKCAALYFATAVEASGNPGSVLGAYRVAYTDDTEERVPVKYAEQALTSEGGELPHTLAETAWIVRRAEPPTRCLVHEWQNPRPDESLASVTFEPTLAGADVGYRVLAVTCAAETHSKGEH